MMWQIGNIIEACFAAITDRLPPERSFRPPLGSAMTRGQEAAALPVPAVRKTTSGPAKDMPTKTGAKATAQATLRRRGKGSTKKFNIPLPREDTRHSAGPAELEAWTTVVRRGKGKKPTKTGPPAGSVGHAAKSTAAAPFSVGTNKKVISTRTVAAATNAGGAARRPAQPKSSARRRRARQPRSAAIVITLAPEAAERGVTYAKILTEAKEKILEEHGLIPVKYRVAQTGARILDVAGSDGASKADHLAKEIRATLEDKGVSVSRPEKTADIRLLGLDKSVTTEEVMAAIRRATQTTGQIRTGPMRMSPVRLGSIWASCPVAVANKLATAGWLLVGWSSARVHLFAPRPLQCFRCVERGHTAQRCPTEKDLSDLYYRCGKPGNLAASCEAMPNCPVCRDQTRAGGRLIGAVVWHAGRHPGEGRGLQFRTDNLAGALAAQHHRSLRVAGLWRRPWTRRNNGYTGKNPPM